MSRADESEGWPGAETPAAETRAAATIDHRRRQARQAAERVLARARFLPPEERWLLEAVYGEGWTIRRVSEFFGSHPRVMSKRIARIVARAQSAEFGFVASRQGTWRGTRRAVAQACVLHGLSQREAARRLGVSLHVVRRQCQAIRGMAEEVV